MGRKRGAKGKKKATEDLQIGEVKAEESLGSDDSDLFLCEMSPIYGRYLVAKKDITKGTLILSEKYLIAGPQRSSDVVCIGCHMEFENPKDRKSCSKCSWPVCSDKCAESAFHIDECKFFVEKEVMAPTRFGNSEFGALTVLRGLMLKYQNPEGWQNLMTLEAHNEIRRNLYIWKENRINVVEVILRDWGLGEYFEEEEAHTVCGILEVNAFELGDKSSYRGIFPKSAMMAHDCIPTTTRFENPLTGVMEVRAAVDIKVGQPLTVCYAFSLEGTAQRRKMLAETKFFECLCLRCKDPRELNSNLSTLICQQCRGDVVNTEVADMCENWVCQSCGINVPNVTVETQFLVWKEVIDRVNEIPKCEKFLKNCTTLFHPTHFIPFEVKFNLCQAYGREKTPLELLSETELERKLEICKDVMKVLDVVTPGYTVTRGLVLYELQAAEIMKARRLRDMNKCSNSNLRRRLQLTLKVLEESVTILEMCHPGSIEYDISQAAKKETVVELSKWINSLK